MKAIIPVAGAGTRLRPLTYTQPKPLIPVAGRRILAYIIDELIDQGVDEFIFIIGYLGEKIKLYVEEAYPDLNKTFVNQTERKGLGHAVSLANSYLDYDDDVIILLGDTIIDMDWKAFFAIKHSALGVKHVANPQQFGVVEINEDKQVVKVVEKPAIPKSNLAMVGIYHFTKIGPLMEALQYNIDNEVLTHNEFQLTDGIQRMVKNGEILETLTVDNWYDCGRKDILLLTNARKLDEMGYTSDDLPHYENTIIINPVAVGKDCDIKNSIIGPHVTIGNNVKIDHSIVEDSIIGNYTDIDEIVLKKSIVGNDAIIKGMKQSLNIGDNTELDFS